MASYYSGWVETDDWRLRLDVTESADNGKCTYSCKLYFQSQYAYTSTRNVPWTITVDGKTYSGTASKPGIGTGQTKQIGSCSHSVSKGTSKKTVKFSFKAYVSGSSNSAYKKGVTGSGSATLAAKPSYTVKYNANGGSGAPGSQTKWYGTTLKLSSTKPTRTGHSFAGWATSASGSVAYQPGGSYTANAAVTLYAKWTANTYTVSYDANGGSGAPASQKKTYGANLTLSSTKPTRANYNFLGWAASASAATAQYAAGGTYTANAAVTLYAVWQLAYTAPRITGVTSQRCTSSGAASESGTYAKVGFKWATDRAVSGIKIVVNGATTTVTGSGTSGTVSQVVGAGALSTEKSYTATVTVSDSGGSSSATTTVAAMTFTIDFLKGGKGVAFGKPASTASLVDSAWKIRSALGLENVQNGVTTTIESYNSSYTHYKTTSNAHWFNKAVNVQGEVYAGSSYNQRLAHIAEVLANAGADVTLGANITEYSSLQPKPRCWKVGGMVYCRGTVKNSVAATKFDPLFTVPSGYRPKDRSFLGLMQGSGSNKWLLEVQTDGKATLDRYSNNTTMSNSVPVGSWLVVQACWIAE